jgi:hypothetical protein
MGVYERRAIYNAAFVPMGKPAPILLFYLKVTLCVTSAGVTM